MTTSIGEEINAATRRLHTPLNRRILALLPLALPPENRTPLLYGYGMLQFLPIYSTFESCFRSLLESPSMPPSTVAFLRKLHIPELERTERLQADVERILDHATMEGMESGASRTQQHFFIEHSCTSLNTKPHLLIAYTWILYMALFSGGRHIRACLRSAGSEFWGLEEGGEPPLKFWTFASINDGEDLKALYKSRILELSAELTELEREEIMAEAVEIMRWMLKLVDEAQEICNPEVSLRGRKLRQPNEEVPLMAIPVLKHFLPTSFIDILEGVSKSVATGLEHKFPNFMRGNSD